jgi:hypothetical protein
MYLKWNILNNAIGKINVKWRNYAYFKLLKPFFNALSL